MSSHLGKFKPGCWCWNCVLSRDEAPKARIESPTLAMRKVLRSLRGVNEFIPEPDDKSPLT